MAALVGSSARQCASQTTRRRRVVPPGCRRAARSDLRLARDDRSFYSHGVTIPVAPSQNNPVDPAPTNAELASQIRRLREELDDIKPVPLTRSGRLAAILCSAGALVLAVVFAIVYLKTSGNASRDPKVDIAVIAGLVLVSTTMQFYDVLKGAWERPNNTSTREAIFFALVWFFALAAAAVAVFAAFN